VNKKVDVKRLGMIAPIAHFKINKLLCQNFINIFNVLYANINFGNYSGRVSLPKGFLGER